MIFKVLLSPEDGVPWVWAPEFPFRLVCKQWSLVFRPVFVDARVETLSSRLGSHSPYWVHSLAGLGSLVSIKGLSEKEFVERTLGISDPCEVCSFESSDKVASSNPTGYVQAVSVIVQNPDYPVRPSGALLCYMLRSSKNFESFNVDFAALKISYAVAVNAVKENRMLCRKQDLLDLCLSRFPELREDIETQTCLLESPGGDFKALVERLLELGSVCVPDALCLALTRGAEDYYRRYTLGHPVRILKALFMLCPKPLCPIDWSVMFKSQQSTNAWLTILFCYLEDLDNPRDPSLFKCPEWIFERNWVDRFACGGIARADVSMYWAKEALRLYSARPGSARVRKSLAYRIRFYSAAEISEPRLSIPWDSRSPEVLPCF